MALTSEAKAAFWRGSTCFFGHHRAPSQAIPENRRVQGTRAKKTDLGNPGGKGSAVVGEAPRQATIESFLSCFFWCPIWPLGVMALALAGVTHPCGLPGLPRRGDKAANPPTPYHSDVAVP